MAEPPAYAPRRFAAAGLWQAEGARLKLYTIALADAASPAPNVLAAAEWLAAATVPPAAEAEGASHGLGFVVLHEGTAGTWLLMQWWAHGDICCQRLARAEPGTADFKAVDERPLLACVWELRVFEHERRAWTRTMMTGRPDAEAYLADRMPDGLY